MNVNIWLAQLVKLVLRLHNISSYLPDDSYSTLFFFHLSTCFFFNNNITVADHLSPGERNSPLTQFIRSVGFFFITCMTPNFMSRLDRILQLNMKQIKFHLFSESKFACPSPLNEKPCIIKYLRRFMIQKRDVTFRNLSSKCATDSIPPFRRQLGNQTKHANLQRVFHEELMWL